MPFYFSAGDLLLPMPVSDVFKCPAGCSGVAFIIVFSMVLHVSPKHNMATPVLQMLLWVPANGNRMRLTRLKSQLIISCLQRMKSL